VVGFNNGTATSTLYNGNTGAKVALTNLPCQCVIVQAHQLASSSMGLFALVPASW
jgi:hypothetical protein